MISRIPNTPDVPYYDFEVELDGVEFKLEFRFNNRDLSWYLTVYDIEGEPLRAGLRIVNDWIITRLWKDESSPLGEIVSITQGDQSGVASLSELGRTVLLNYIDEGEFNA